MWSFLYITKDSSSEEYFRQILNYDNWSIGIMVRVFATGLGEQGSIPDWVIPKIQKVVLDTSSVL